MLVAFGSFLHTAHVITLHDLSTPPDLPPTADKAMPGASADECTTYNRSRKAQAVAIHLLRGDARGRNVADAEILDAAAELGWPTSSPSTLAAVRAALAFMNPAASGRPPYKGLEDPTPESRHHRADDESSAPATRAGVAILAAQLVAVLAEATDRINQSEDDKGDAWNEHHAAYPLYYAIDRAMGDIAQVLEDAGWAWRQS
ncbi:hypothetical protein [Streptomyces sp. NPDC059893]|uniref:hypothetical protein n=1 Tax=Streptomyces sp. NPDC059893 TaxID=3346990 RepID=UPI0036565B84